MSKQPELKPTLTSAPGNPAPARRARSTQLDFFVRLFSQGKAVLGITILAVFILLALFAPLITPGDPTRFVGRPNQPPSAAHWLGTTGQGQDVFAQVVVGSRISLLVGFTVGLLITVLG